MAATKTAAASGTGDATSLSHSDIAGESALSDAPIAGGPNPFRRRVIVAVAAAACAGAVLVQRPWRSGGVGDAGADGGGARRGARAGARTRVRTAPAPAPAPTLDPSAHPGLGACCRAPPRRRAPKNPTREKSTQPAATGRRTLTNRESESRVTEAAHDARSTFHAGLGIAVPCRLPDEQQVRDAAHRPHHVADDRHDVHERHRAHHRGDRSPLDLPIELRKDGAAFTTLVPPAYEYSWDTTKAVEASYVLTAEVAFSNETAKSAPVTIVVDRTPPTISRTPSPGAVDVMLRAPIQVAFSEPIVLSRAPEATFTLSSDGAIVPTDITLDSQGQTATIGIGDPSALPLPTTLVATITGPITDRAGNPAALPSSDWFWDVPIVREAAALTRRPEHPAGDAPAGVRGRFGSEAGLRDGVEHDVGRQPPLANPGEPVRRHDLDAARSPFGRHRFGIARRRAGRRRGTTVRRLAARRP